MKIQNNQSDLVLDFQDYVGSPSIIVTQETPSRNNLSKRSKSVCGTYQSQRQQKSYRIERVFNVEEERSKSRISKLLNQPINVQNHQHNSSFVEEYPLNLKTIKKDFRDITERAPLKSDLYIGDNDDKLTELDQSYLPMIQVSRNMQQLLNPQSQQDYKTLRINLSRNASNLSYAQTNINKTSQASIVTKMMKSRSKTSNIRLKYSQNRDQTSSPLSKTIVSPQEIQDRHLSREISKEKNVFKRQKMLFNLLDQAKDRNLGDKSMELLFNKKNLLKNAKSKTDISNLVKKNQSIFKTEKSDSTIIQGINPTFPLQREINLFQRIQMENEEELKIKLQDIISAKHPLTKLINNSEVEKAFDLEQAIYRNKMGDMSELMDKKFFDVRQKYLDDEYILKKYQEQMELKAKIKGRQLTSNKKYSVFLTQKWPKLKDLYDHQGNQISKTGLKMDEEQAQKQEEEELRQKMLLKNQKEAQSQATLQAANESKKDPQNNSLEEDSLSDDMKDQKLDHEPTNSTMINDASAQHLNIQQTDKLLDKELKNLELKQLVNRRDFLDKQITILEKQKTKALRKDIDKINQMQDKLRKEKQKRIQELKEQMTQEEQEYWEEQKQLKQQDMLVNIESFLGDQKSKILEINEDIIKMENDSDDEFGIYQNFANTQIHMLAKQQVLFKDQQQRNLKDLQKMLVTVNDKQEIVKRIGKYFRENIKKTLDQEIILSQNQIIEAKNNKGFMKAMEKAQQKQEFGKLIQEVFEKKENIDYVKKSKRKSKKNKRINQGASNESNNIYGEDRDNENDNDQQDEDSYNSQSEDLSNQGDDKKYDNYDYQHESFEEDEERERKMIEQKLAEEESANMARKYLQFCKNEKVLPLPILNKIEDGVLALEDYKLNFGLCKALGNVLDDLGSLIRKIVLKNNGINDLAYSEILKGALQNKYIKSLHIKNNEFRDESLHQITTYFKDTKRPTLEEIAIINCRQTLSHTNELLQSLSSYNGLQVLALSQARLDKESVLLIADIANSNTNLRELNLSWNEITSINMWELIQNIEYCRHIQYLNLSFNSFAGPKTKEIIESLSNMIRRNRNLLHLDLSYCALKNEELLEVVKACKKSRSLLAVHISGNLITDKFKKKIREILRPRRRIKDVYDLINNPDDNADFKVPQDKTLSMDLEAAIEQKLKNYQNQDQNQPFKNNQKGDSNAMKGNPGERLIFSRVLGHFELPRSYKWHESSECWICEKYRYTLMVFSKSIANSFFVRPNQKEKQILVQKINLARDKEAESLQLENDDEAWGSDNDDIYYDADTEAQKGESSFNKQIASTFNKWKCQSIMPIHEFIRRLKKNQQINVKQIQIEKDVYEQQVKLIREKQIIKNQQKYKRKRELRKQFKSNLIFDQSNGDWYDKMTDKDKISLNQLKELESNLPRNIISNMLISLDRIIEAFQENKKILDPKEKAYVFAGYLPPGKHNTCLIYNTTNVPCKDLFSFVTTIKPRQELLPLSKYIQYYHILENKSVKEYRIKRKFEKPVSMFKDYVDENHQNLKKAIQKDLENSKLSRFIRDILEFRRVTDVLLEYTSVIRDLFTYSIALSSFPSISWIDFTNLCSEWSIPDNRTCTMQTIDRVFIATNVELVEQEDNPDRDLCRFEFYEIIVRMGGAKYKDSGQVDSWDEATKKIIKDNLIANSKHMGGQSFRDQYIWNLPIDDLFRANFENVQKLYNKYTNAGKRWLELNDCLEIVAALEISEFDLKQAYAFSKMLIIDEMNQKDKYEKMVISEFMEFLCRCAYFKFKQDQNLSFLEKVERVLDILFKQIDCKRLKPDYEIEVSSESDYSTDD